MPSGGRRRAAENTLERASRRLADVTAEIERRRPSKQQRVRTEEWRSREYAHAEYAHADKSIQEIGVFYSPHNDITRP